MDKIALYVGGEQQNASDVFGIKYALPTTYRTKFVHHNGSESMIGLVGTRFTVKVSTCGASDR